MKLWQARVPGSFGVYKRQLRKHGALAIVFATATGVTALDPPTNRPDIDSLMTAGRKLRLTGDCAKALSLFSQARVLASQSNQPRAEASAGVASGACKIRLFRYRSALADLSAAENAAQRVDDRDLLGASAGNISVIYSQLGDYVAAEAASLRAVEYLRRSQRHDYLASALINLGEIEFGLNRTARGEQSFHEAIEVAKKFGLRRKEASARDDLGIWLVLKGRLPEAQPLLQSAYVIRSSEQDVEGLSTSLEHLAELQEKLGGVMLPQALANVNQVLQSKTKFRTIDPAFYPFHLRGRILLKLQRTEEALRDFRQAVIEAESWRQDALPGDAVRVRTSARLAEVYQDCIQLLAALSIKTGNRTLLRESFQLTLRQQGHSLGDKLASALLQKEDYRSLLEQLQSAQARVTLSEQGTSPTARNDARQSLSLIRANLRDFENRFGVDRTPQTVAFQDVNAIAKLQTSLTSDTALLSFALGSPSTYLWALTRTGLDLYALPAKSVIAQQADAFRAATRSGAAGSDAGAALSQNLFGKLSPEVLAKKEWLISGDGDLLDLMPWAALPSPDKKGEYIVHQHATRMIASIRLFSRNNRTLGGFVGVADPVYNHADPRYISRKKISSAQNPKGTLLARLVGSQKEVETAAHILSLHDTNVLLGPHARVRDLVHSMDSRDTQVIHFAVHVVAPKDRPGEAALALSIGDESFPELLTPETVATFRVPGALVVLSGCASQQGDIVPGAGIVGLSRSWILAGAEAVIVSAWPTPDNSGDFFQSFYQNFRIRKGSLAQRASLALRDAQLLDMSSGHYQSRTWAAYSVIARD